MLRLDLQITEQNYVELLLLAMFYLFLYLNKCNINKKSVIVGTVLYIFKMFHENV